MRLARKIVIGWNGVAVFRRTFLDISPLDVFFLTPAHRHAGFADI